MLPNTNNNIIIIEIVIPIIASLPNSESFSKKKYYSVIIVNICIYHSKDYYDKCICLQQTAKSFTDVSQYTKQQL